MAESIQLPDQDVASMGDIAPDVAGLNIVFVNVYAVEAAQNWVLIDAGIPHSKGRILRWAEEHFAQRRPVCILLTHGHFDHVGSVRELAESWNVPVYAHPLEMPFLTSQQKYAPADPSVGGGLMAALSPIYSRGPIDITGRVRTLPQDGSVPGLPGWRWIHTPGHTPGHVSYFRSSDRVLLVGDAFCTTKPEAFMTAVVTQRPELHGPPSYFTPDWSSAKRSVENLAILEPQVIAPGHGNAMRGSDLTEALANFAAQFERLGMPQHGEYVPETNR